MTAITITVARLAGEALVSFKINATWLIAPGGIVGLLVEVLMIGTL